MTDYVDGIQRINGSAELLQAVPYLLGFHPHRSVVLVGLADGMLAVTVRLDLSDAFVPRMLDDTIGRLVRAGTDEMIAIVYPQPDVGDPDGWSALASMLVDTSARHGALCGDVLLVDQDRWRSLLCESVMCCPPDGRALSQSVSSFAAAATVAGVVPLRDREALEQTLDPLPDWERAALLPMLDEAEVEVERARLEGTSDRRDRSIKRRIFAMARVSDEVCDAKDSVPRAVRDDVVDDETAARFAVALRDPAMRNAVWMAIDDGRLDGRPLWCELSRRLPVRYAAYPLFLYGWAAWRSGNGALALIAAQRAAATDSECTPALLLLAALEHAVDPRRLPRLRTARTA